MFATTSRVLIVSWFAGALVVMAPDSAVAEQCTSAGLARGCVTVEGGCWCRTGSYGSGVGVCGHPANHAGTYYSITGRTSDDPNGPMDGQKAVNIITALGLTPHPSFCDPATAEIGSCKKTCSCDCATNIDMTGGAWGTSLTCWTNASRWARGFGIVRCTPFEVPEPDVVDLVELTARRDGGDRVTLAWETASEVACGQFELRRCIAGMCTVTDHAVVDGVPRVPCRDSVAGGRYTLVDPGATADVHWSYVLREYETTGAVRFYGPVVLRAGATEAAWHPEDGEGPVVDPGGDSRGVVAPPRETGCAMAAGSGGGEGGGLAWLVAACVMAMGARVRRGARG